MQRTKTITVDNLPITFTEIPVDTLLKLLVLDNPIFNLPLNAAFKELAGLIPHAIDCPLERILDLKLFSDDMTAIEEAFRETNPYFFQLALRLDLVAELKWIIKSIIGHYCSTMLSSLNVDTPESGDMG